MSRLPRLVSLLLAALATAVLTGVATAGGTPAKPLAADPVFVVAGGGWGHGVGMSQWGAYGQAQAGRSFDQILGTYYAGTELSRSSKASVRVLMSDGVPSAAFAADGDVVVRDGTGRKLRVRDGAVEIPASFQTTLQVTLKPKRTKVTLTPPVRITPTAGLTISYGGVARRGDYVVSASGTGLLVVNELPMEAYLRGVVPGEMPVGWPLEALKAQAVAARTYAITSLLSGKPYDLYADVRSQVYKGVPGENPATDRAVLETSGQILTYQGAPARTFYFSSSGGRTASAADVFGTDVPYLQSVDDPWDEVSPHHVWAPKVFTAAALGKAFGLRAAAADVVSATPSPEGVAQLASAAPAPPARLRVLGQGGVTVEVSRADVRNRLGLASTTFRIGVLALGTPPPSARPGALVTLSGVARGVDAPVLEKQRPDGSWQVAKRLAPRADGTFSIDVRPVATTTFRVTGSSVAGPTASVAVPTLP
jgi:stage II sporulation protein D